MKISLFLFFFDERIYIFQYCLVTWEWINGFLFSTSFSLRSGFLEYISLRARIWIIVSHSCDKCLNSVCILINYPLEHVVTQINHPFACIFHTKCDWHFEFVQQSSLFISRERLNKCLKSFRKLSLLLFSEFNRQVFNHWSATFLLVRNCGWIAWYGRSDYWRFSFWFLFRLNFIWLRL